MIDLATALITAVSAEAAAIVAIWYALNNKVNRAESACEHDREILRQMVRKLAQLDRRSDLPTVPD